MFWGFFVSQIFNVNPDQADTYKCFATNEFGEAVCTAVLNVKNGKSLMQGSTLLYKKRQ